MIVRVAIKNSDEYLWIQKTPLGEYCTWFNDKKLKLIASSCWAFPSSWYFDTLNKKFSFSYFGLAWDLISTSVKELQQSKTKYIILNEGRVSEC